MWRGGVGHICRPNAGQHRQNTSPEPNRTAFRPASATRVRSRFGYGRPTWGRLGGCVRTLIGQFQPTLRCRSSVSHLGSLHGSPAAPVQKARSNDASPATPAQSRTSKSRPQAGRVLDRVLGQQFSLCACASRMRHLVRCILLRRRRRRCILGRMILPGRPFWNPMLADLLRAPGNLSFGDSGALPGRRCGSKQSENVCGRRFRTRTGQSGIC